MNDSTSDRAEHRLSAEHLTHLKAYCNAPIDERGPHLAKMTAAWRRLKDLVATDGARDDAIAYMKSIGKIRS